MGRKGQSKYQKINIKPKQLNTHPNHRKLLPLVDKLLRVTTVPTEPNVSKNLQIQMEIDEVINQVIKLEKELEPLSSDLRYSAATLEQFTKWAKENGAEFEGTKIADFPGYELGLQAEIKIKASSLVIAVPRNLMITVEAAKTSALGPLIEKDPLLSNMSNVALALFLLLEMFKGDSFWKPYLDILPTSYSTVLYFTFEELNELHSSPTLETALKQIKNIVRQYAYFWKLIWSSEEPSCGILRKHFTFQQYRWAVSTIMTRQNTIPSEDSSHLISALIPLWDICNHTNGNISTDYNPELKRSECLAVKDFQPGEQIFIFYGARSNDELFVHNGFVYEDNDHDGYWLRLGVSKSDKLLNKRTELLNRLALPEHGEFWIKKGSLPIDGQLLAFLRIFNMDEGQLHQWLECDKITNLLDFKFELEPAFEKKYWTFIHTRLKLILSSYKTTLEEDQKLLDDKKLSRNRVLATKMRMTEKSILLNAMNYALIHVK